MKLAVLGISAWAVLLGSCSQTPITVNLHSLQASGNVSFVCRGDDNAPTGHKLDACPDNETTTRRLFGLVTQTATNEVAVIDLVAGAVVDDDPSTPGYSFLRVGARPGAIVSTPGGAASFVGVTGLQKNGIFALPTTCLAAPKLGQQARDLTSWSACALTSAPGDITVLIDPAQNELTRSSCVGSSFEPVPEVEAQQVGRECPADLTHEGGPKGRRKLLVSLPEEHKLVLLDAQELLDAPAGEFAPCHVEPVAYNLAEAPETTPATPVLPPDLLPSSLDSAVCPATSYPLAQAGEQPTPGGFAVAGDRLFVADRALSVVHEINVAEPCAPVAQKPLLPRAYLSPNRNVTTSRVALSPLTPNGKQFVYAVDELDQPTASVMVFDVSPGATNRTPLVFPGAPRQPYLPPDRLRFSAPVRDVSFVMRDFPASAVDTGAGAFGLSCDPYPNSSSAATQYRPNGDFSDGARPVNLRGVFGFAMLTNGQVAVIDVEDFDAACRRPVTSNRTAFEDFRGCVSDKPGPDGQVPTYFTTDGAATSVPTVTNESSCNVIEAHRPRAASLSISSSAVGLRAPTLRSFPQFSNPGSTVVTVDNQPHMLAVNFPNPNPAKPTAIPAQVNVSAQLYANCDDNTTDPACQPGVSQRLELDPHAAIVQDSLTLPLVEPRSYAQDESPTLTFEGSLFQARTSGFLKLSDDPKTPTADIQDPDANFCAAGVEDSVAIAAEGNALSLPAAKLSAWGTAHADYVQITGDFPGVDDVYWRLGQGQSCAALIDGRSSSDPSTNRASCETEFGTIDNLDVLKESRDLSIREAYSGRLSVAPRHCAGASDCALTLQKMACCFPAGTAYTVRASHQWLLSAAAGLHDIGADSTGRCVHTASCDPRKKYFRSRAFEVCDSNRTYDPLVDTDGACSVKEPNVGCVFAGTHTDSSGNVQSNGPVQPGGDASQCIFENLTSRFIVYRGGQPSARGMAFSWQTTGGFVPLSMSLATQSSAVNPQSMSYLPELGYLAVVDGSTLGLSLFDLNSLGVVAPSPFF